VNSFIQLRVLRILFPSLALLALAAASFAPTQAALPAASSCPALTALVLPNGTITQSNLIAAGNFALSPDEHSQDSVEQGFKDVPTFCRVAVTLRPSGDSDIRMEVWMPASGWNGKLQSVGNGGWAGAISYGAMSQAVMSGYATASTDTGHTGNRGTFALGHPEKLVDFGYRAVHEMTAQAKSIIEAYYGKPARISYWNGCSTGGREGLKEAQRFPNDYDGIIAGAAANPRTHLSTWQIWIGQAMLQEPGAFIPKTKYAMIHKAVLDACDALDGVKDGLINDPTLCHFNPSTLLCAGTDSPNCLTAPQVNAMTKILTPVRNPRTGKEIFPTYEAGTELGWGLLAGGTEPFIYALDQYRYVVFQDPNWDWRTLNFDRDVELADKVDNDTINAVDPHLSQFVAHGGKLFLYHGWADPNVAPRASIEYYNSVVEVMGGARKTAGWVRLFMMPGMGHCEGGEGPDTFDKMAVIENWVEKGQAPERIVAAHLSNGVVDRTRPLCPYPQIAAYNGAGSINDAANFVCKTP
jgi:tannase/feruloyl esterase